MNIKQASEQSGVSAPNIRFYEKEGLLTRRAGRAMATAIIPQGISARLNLSVCCGCWMCRCPPSRRCVRGEQPLQQALQAQQTVLEQQAAQLAAAMQFCADLARQAPQTDTLDVDACLTRMESPAHQQGFFSGWLQDYCTLAKVQHQSTFSLSRSSINTPQEFTAALQAMQRKRGCEFTLTKRDVPGVFAGRHRV